MSIAQLLLREFEAEMAATRKTLGRFPEDKTDFRPHPKSMTMGRLAGHIAELPGWAATTMTTNELDIMPGGKPAYTAFSASNRDELLAMFDKNVAAAAEAIAKASDADFDVHWSLLMNGKAWFTKPRYEVVRDMAVNHIIHHRAQFGVYLRLNELPVPSVYGPTADEGQMMGASS